MRTWLDTDAAQFTKTQILVASDGTPRIELYQESVLIDTVPVARYNRDEMNALLEEMGQPRNLEMTWDKIKNEAKLAEAFSTNNFSQYNEILKKDEEERIYEERRQE